MGIARQEEIDSLLAPYEEGDGNRWEQDRSESDKWEMHTFPTGTLTLTAAHFLDPNPDFLALTIC